MDLNLILLWIVTIANIGAIVRTIRDPYYNSRGWIYSGSFIILVAAIAFITVPDWAGYIGFALWLLFGLLPTQVFRRYQHHLRNHDYAYARRLLRWQRFIHPVTDWSEWDTYLSAHLSIADGNLAHAEKILGKVAAGNTAVGQRAKFDLFWLTGDWEGQLTWITTDFDDDDLAVRGDILPAYLRALGETGQLNQFLQTFKRHWSSLERYGTNFPICSMFAFAYCGRRDALAKLLPAVTPILPAHVPEFWLATADLAAGKEETAHQQFQAILAAEGASRMRTTIDRRLRLGLAQADETLTPESQTILAEIASTWEKLEKYRPHPKEETGLPYLTYALIGLNVVMFLLQMAAGGSQDVQVAYRLGAVLPSAVIDGQWWRLIAALFLHYGFVHLFFNMFALYNLGRGLEHRLGRLNYLVTYFVAGIGSMLVVVLLETALQPARPSLVVGASGSVLGLIGAMSAIMWRAWRTEGVQLARRQLVSILILLGLQFTLDVVIPQISLTAHLSGAAIGFIVASLFAPQLSRPRRVTLEKA
jgi:rhomboid protease GluP